MVSCQSTRLVQCRVGTGGPLRDSGQRRLSGRQCSPSASTPFGEPIASEKLTRALTVVDAGAVDEPGNLDRRSTLRGMRKFQFVRLTQLMGPKPEQIAGLLWRYEVSEDGGKSWRPEVDGEAPTRLDSLRRGSWVYPPTLQ
jgi:hypothetical protein